MVKSRLFLVFAYSFVIYIWHARHPVVPSLDPALASGPAWRTFGHQQSIHFDEACFPSFVQAIHCSINTFVFCFAECCSFQSCKVQTRFLIYFPSESLSTVFFQTASQSGTLTICLILVCNFSLSILSDAALASASAFHFVRFLLKKDAEDSNLDFPALFRSFIFCRYIEDTVAIKYQKSSSIWGITTLGRWNISESWNSSELLYCL